MHCHDLETLTSNPSHVVLGVISSSKLYLTTDFIRKYAVISVMTNETLLQEQNDNIIPSGSISQLTVKCNEKYYPFADTVLK